jgi:hypothetical protein
MRTAHKWILAAALTAGLCAAECGAAIERVGAFSRVVSAEVQGYVYYADGETAAEGVPVRVWDALTREFIYETQTNEDGHFNFPKLEPGKYYVTFDWVKLELEVLDKGLPYAQQPHDIIVIIPRGTGFMPMTHLHTLLLATTVSEAALLYRKPPPQDPPEPPEPPRPPVVSP